MSATAQLAALLRLGVPAVTTADVSAVLGVSVTAASHAMRRFAAEGLVKAIRKGLWSLRAVPDPIELLEYVTSPYPAYVSLQSALFLHGMVSQIPAMTFAVTLGRGGRVTTTVGTYSVHHVEPGFFDGFELLPNGAKLATPEKALVDLFYLSATRVRSFAALPEVEFPRRFRRRIARQWVERIPTPRLREVASRRLEALLSRSR